MKLLHNTITSKDFVENEIDAILSIDTVKK